MVDLALFLNESVRKISLKNVKYAIERGTDLDAFALYEQNALLNALDAYFFAVEDRPPKVVERAFRILSLLCYHGANVFASFGHGYPSAFTKAHDLSRHAVGHVEQEYMDRAVNLMHEYGGYEITCACVDGLDEYHSPLSANGTDAETILGEEPRFYEEVEQFN